MGIGRGWEALGLEREERDGSRGGTKCEAIGAVHFMAPKGE